MGYLKVYVVLDGFRRDFKLERVKQALSDVEVFRLTILDVQGFGRQLGHAETYRGHEIAINLLRKVQLQIAINDEFVEPTEVPASPSSRVKRTAKDGGSRIRTHKDHAN